MHTGRVPCDDYSHVATSHPTTRSGARGLEQIPPSCVGGCGPADTLASSPGRESISGAPMAPSVLLCCSGPRRLTHRFWACWAAWQEALPTLTWESKRVQLSLCTVMGSTGLPLAGTVGSDTDTHCPWAAHFTRSQPTPAAAGAVGAGMSSAGLLLPTAPQAKRPLSPLAAYKL